MKWSAAIGKVCFLSGKSDAPQRRTHLRERVNTFSFCGTGGSFLFCRDRSLRPFVAIGGRKRRTRCNRLLRSAVASIGRTAVVRCDHSPRSADASVGRVAVVCCDWRSRALAALRSFVAVGYGIAGRAPLSPFAPRGVSSFLRRFCEACPLFARLRQTSRGRFAAHHLSDGVLRRIPGKIIASATFFLNF